MQIRDWGEQGFIDHLLQTFPSNKEVKGIGDDCAVIPLADGTSQLITTDALVEGVHFLKEQIKPQDLGYKTVAVNVSDIVAMGGKPQYAFLTIALTKDTDCQWLKTFVQGIKEGFNQFEVLLLGGDTVSSKKDLFLNLTLVGYADSEKIKYRHTATLGDIICVTNFLGDSGGGFRILQERTPLNQNKKLLIKSHVRPSIQLNEGLWLASHKEIHAMMDLSDGLDVDLRRILKASHCGAVIDVDCLPISKALQQVGREYEWDISSLALAGGEDYCLLVTVSRDAFEEVSRQFHQHFFHSLYPIGQVTDDSEQLIYRDHGKIVPIHPITFSHF